MKEFSIRPATKCDIPQIIDIENRVHKSPWNAEHFIAEIKKPFAFFWVLTDDETDSQIAAYIIFWIIGEVGSVLNLVTDLEFRGMGYAQHMVRSGVRQALKQSCNKMILEVRKSNSAAIGLYQKTGFTISRIQKAMYSDGEDAYHMSMPLDQNQFPDF